MKKLLVFALISIVFAVCGCQKGSSDKVFNREEIISEVGGLYEASEFVWKDNSAVELKSVFVDKDHAFEQIKDISGGLITTLRIKYLLPEFAQENHEKYDAALWDYRLEKYGYPGNAPYEVMALNWFLSVWHNYETNKYTVEINGLNDDVSETFTHLGDGKLGSVKILCAEFINYLATNYEIGEFSEDNFAAYAELLKENKFETESNFKFEAELLKMFLDE